MSTQDYVAWIMLLGALGGLGGLMYGYKREAKGYREEAAELRKDNAAIRGELAMAKRSMQAFARKLTDDTGPIAVDRPTPAPRTVTGIPSARPEVPRTGSTASEAANTPASIGPRHRATKKKAS